MSWLGDLFEKATLAADHYLARDEKQRIAAARAKAVYELRLREQEHARAEARRVAAEQEAARVAARVEAARVAAAQAAEAEELYSAAEAERAAKAADGSEP